MVLTFWTFGDLFRRCGVHKRINEEILMQMIGAARTMPQRLAQGNKPSVGRRGEEISKRPASAAKRELAPERPKGRKWRGRSKKQSGDSPQ